LGNSFSVSGKDYFLGRPRFNPESALDALDAIKGAMLIEVPQTEKPSQAFGPETVESDLISKPLVGVGRRS
jgi:hypothetical protein